MSFIFKTTFKTAADLTLAAFVFLIHIMWNGIVFSGMQGRWLAGNLVTSHVKEEGI